MYSPSHAICWLLEQRLVPGKSSLYPLISVRLCVIAWGFLRKHRAMLLLVVELLVQVLTSWC